MKKVSKYVRNLKWEKFRVVISPQFSIYKKRGHQQILCRNQKKY